MSSHYFLATLVLVLTLHNSAHSFQSTILFDDESEAAIETIVQPLLIAANIKSQPSIVVISNCSANAMTDGHYLWIFTGAITELGHNPGYIAGVLAHEVSHIALGHSHRGIDERSVTLSEMLISGTSLLAAIQNNDPRIYYLGRNIARLHSIAGD